jgi:hypothetical protein
MTVPGVFSSVNFSSARPIAFWFYSSTFLLCTPGDPINSASLDPQQKTIASSILDGFAVSYNGRVGTLAGIYAPGLVGTLSTSTGSTNIDYSYRVTLLYQLAPE